jgi:hypothetical protein
MEIVTNPVQEWRRCVKCPQYECCRDGLIRHVKSLKPTPQYYSPKGYSTIKYYIASIKAQKNAKVHRLIAEAFIPNPNLKREVDHKDGNKQNNSVENLRWATRSENCSNKPKPVGKSNQYRGVYNYYGKFRVGISQANKMVWLGTYPTADEGATAYNEWVINNGQQEYRQLNQILVAP